MAGIESHGVREVEVAESSSLCEAHQLFLDDLSCWVNACKLDLGHTTIDNHDQGTVCSSWELLISEGQDDGLLAWLKVHRDAIKSHHETTGLWKHGYWKEQEAHHGTEHFEIFLSLLCRLDPHDEETLRQLLDATEHIGNWVQGVPEWFDWEQGVFRSMFLGTEKVGLGEGERINIPDHLRCVNLALLAYRMSTEKRYAELAVTHGGKWADAILQGEDLPIGLNPSGRGIYALEGSAEAAYRSFAGMAPANLDELGRAENFLASNGIQTFLDLFELTGENRFLRAAERILDALVCCLTDPDSGCVVAALWNYEQAIGSGRYAPRFTEALSQLGSEVQKVAIRPQVYREAQPRGAGKRRDMPVWYHDGRERSTSPVHLAHLSLIRGDQNLAKHALDVGRAMFRLGREVYPHGRHHGCNSRSVSAIARGHGRDNNIGVVTGALEPLSAIIR